MYLHDTDTLIYNLNGDENVRQHILRHIDDPILISVPTLMELYYGAYKSQKKTSNLSKVKTLAQAMEVVPAGPEIADIFGLLKSDLEATGTRLDDFDLTIAAIALAHNLTLVTNNEKLFGRIDGLKLQNWTKT
jgi:tRNA(fMet)-specific endonuclease VapC